MGKPINFPQADFVWKGWEREEGKPDVSDLPSCREGNTTISCWKFTWKERLLILFGGVAWLRVLGDHPPVNVDGITPFLENNEVSS